MPGSEWDPFARGDDAVYDLVVEDTGHCAGGGGGVVPEATVLGGNVC